MRKKLIQIGAQLVTAPRYLIFRIVESAVPRTLFAAILERIPGLRRPAVGVLPSR